MATFVHIFPESAKARITRNGIRPLKTGWRLVDGVFLMPVVQSYVVTHQWNREIERVRNVPKLAARIRIGDDEKVHVGVYNQYHEEVSAAEAIAIAAEHTGMTGFEVVLPRKVEPKEIIRIYRPDRNVGWRYSPKSNGRRPCPCQMCQRGEPFSSKLRAQEDDY